MIQLYLIKMHELEIVISRAAAGEAFRARLRSSVTRPSRDSAPHAFARFVGQRLIELVFLGDDLSLVPLNEKADWISRRDVKRLGCPPSTATTLFSDEGAIRAWAHEGESLVSPEKEERERETRFANSVSMSEIRDASGRERSRRV